MRMKSTVIICIVAATAVNMHVYGQVESPTSALRRSFSSPDEILTRLNSREEDIRKRIAASIGLIVPNTNVLCYDFDGVDSAPAEFITGVHSKLVVVRSQSCQSVSLIPISQKGTEWIALKPIVLWSKFSEPSYRLDELISSGEQQIVVSNLTVDEGTGILERDLMIYKISLDGDDLVFDQPEIVHFTAPHGNSTFQDNERSTFEFRKNGEGVYGTGMIYINEKREITVGGKSLTLYRSYTWNRTLGRFRGVATAPSQ
jgi:hypothetical protein